MRARGSLASWGFAVAVSSLVGCSSSSPTAPSASASVAAPAPVARRDLGSLADFETRWNVAVSRDGKVPKIGDVVLARRGDVDVFELPAFDLGAPVTLGGTVDPKTQNLLRATLTIASRDDDARSALVRAIAPLLDAIDPNATVQQHRIAELSIPSGASGSGDFQGGYSIAFAPTPTGGAELSITPTTAARLDEISKGTATPIR